MCDKTVFTNCRKSSRNGGDNCVEVAFATDGAAGVRHSKNLCIPLLRGRRNCC